MHRRSGNCGYTLLEVLVASGIFVFLGAALVTLMRQGVQIWKTAETRGRIYERARAILDTVADDLRGLSTDVGAGGQRFWVRLIADDDPNGRQRVRFVRVLPGETSDPVARFGGEFLTRDDSTYYDHHADLAEAERGLILPPAGLQEIVYAMDPDPSRDVLWRGVRSPVGGAGTLFSDRNIELDPEAKKRSTAARGTASAERKTGEPSKDENPLERVARPVAGDILFLGFRFWSPQTVGWEPPETAASSRSRTTTRKFVGPTRHWDSTRAILTADDRDDPFSWRPRKESLSDPGDDIFPERVEVTLVVRGNPEAANLELAEDLGVKASEIHLQSTSGLPETGPNRYLRIGEADGPKEWIRYESISRDSVKVARDGRGVRGSRARKHVAGTPVEFGTPFRRVIEIPAYRRSVPPGDPDSRARGRSNRRPR